MLDPSKYQPEIDGAPRFVWRTTRIITNFDRLFDFFGLYLAYNVNVNNRGSDIA